VYGTGSTGRIGSTDVSSGNASVVVDKFRCSFVVTQLLSLPVARVRDTVTLAMPADTNSHGDILGGWPLSQMDVGRSVFV
jgi:hypothetical protein